MGCLPIWSMRWSFDSRMGFCYNLQIMKKQFLLLVLVGLLVSICHGAESQVAVAASKVVGNVEVICRSPGDWRFDISVAPVEDGVEEVRIVLTAPEAASLPAFTVSADVPKGVAQHVWDVTAERYSCNWTSRESSFCSGVPVRTAFDDADTNVFALAVSEGVRKVRLSGSVELFDDNRHVMRFQAAYAGEWAKKSLRYETRLRLDARKVFWSDPVRDAMAWFNAVNGISPAVPPPAAGDPLYSSWYAFRDGVTEARLEPELEQAAALGMKAAILDDGWQTARGDWEVDEAKFPDLRAQVERAHARGTKFVLWFSLAHIERGAACFKRFSGMVLDEKPDQWGLLSFDPRYTEVRRHLVGRLAELMEKYDLDGFKLDFVDSFAAPSRDLAAARGFAGCDCRTVEEGAEKLLAEAFAAIRARKQDALVEFRHPYVGPRIRQYGNMFRAQDCPGDWKANRMRTVALRLVAGGSAVHSDMLLWGEGEGAREVKLQAANVMFSTIQYSAFLGSLPEESRKALRDCIAFSQAHRRTLLGGTFVAHHPELGYPVVEAESAEERIVAVYAPDMVVHLPADGKRTFIVNGSFAPAVPVARAGAIQLVPLAPGEWKEYSGTGPAKPL